MNKNIWGPSIWNVIHTATINYPVLPTMENRNHISNLIHSISEQIPCTICKEHFKEKIHQFPINDVSREKLFKWGVDIHNQVNKQLNKKQLSYKKVKKIYETKYNMKINFNSKNTFNKGYRTVYNVLLVLLVLIFIYLYFKK
tara:strand:- start:976 stop:1401 length:426 start_codon:yes stop_codon:yes gene_type:complete